ncbi:hypothetical protein PG994_005261 [Apiospora phragmitis]|uniref:Zn(2)-C6 fungal-type domain-containing protein n=1 Tax=Apiospora phragmitis TaxID=2905665 RepID=A0ABR1VU54_9PEZI
MLSDTSSRIRSHKKRTNVACDFCRQRKLGCDNAKPKCENCHAHQRSCTYAVRIKNDRPSNSQINCLKEENAKLYSTIEGFRRDLKSAQDSRRDGHRVDSQRDTHGPEEAVVPNTVDTSSHSQQVFRGTTGEAWTGLRRKNDAHPVVDETQKLQLLAEAAKQHGAALLSIFWNRQHATGSAVYRPTFMRDMAVGGPHFSPLLLNAMFFVAVKHVPGIQGLDERAGTRFRRKVEQMLPLLLISDALFSWCDERSLSRHYLGVAINMIVDLGIHCERSRQSLGYVEPAACLEVKRRLFWSSFGKYMAIKENIAPKSRLTAEAVLDKIQSIYQGRPTRLRYTDNDVPIVFMDEYEELEPFNTFGYASSPRTLEYPTHSVSALEALCKLSIVADRILCSLYSEISAETEPRDLIQICRHLQVELSQWRESLPAHLSRYVSRLGHPFTPTLHGGGPSGLLPEQTDPLARDAFAHCDAAATQIDAILRHYTTLYCLKSPPYFISYATYVSATIHAHIAAAATTTTTTNTTQQLEPGQPGSSVAHRRLRTCLEILSGHQEVCHAPRRTLAILLKLMARLGVDVGRAFVAEVSRTQPCDISRTDGADEVLHPVDYYGKQQQASVRSHTHTRTRTTPDDSSHAIVVVGDTGSVAGPSAAEPLQFSRESIREPVSSGAMTGQDPSLGSDLPAFEHDLDELLPGISLDLDPLFGFDITEMEPAY